MKPVLESRRTNERLKIICGVLDKFDVERHQNCQHISVDRRE